jgi:serine/threonine protein kinase
MKVAMASGSTAGSNKSDFVPPGIDELRPKFPQLEVIALIGRGGMGAVYKARQRELDRIVALKILPPGIGDDAIFAERFAREARALAKLNHPGIVTIHDFGRVDGLYFFLMDFVDGVNLRQLLAVGRVSPREALAIVPEICDALQFAHDQGIVHRDIKPENILLDRRGHVKIADFGLARIVATNLSSAPQPESTGAGAGPQKSASLTAQSKVLGTPDYMAPEQIDNPEEVDHRADIYALGVVFYQMLTGELPGHSLQPPSKRIQIDVRLDEVVLRAIEAKPELRYQHVTEVKTSLETIAATLSDAAKLTPQLKASTSSRSKLDQPSTLVPPSGPVELSLKWLPGARIVEEMDTRQSMLIYQPGQPEPAKQDLTLCFQHGFTVLNETPVGSHEVELEFIGVRMGMVMGSYQWQYDSKQRSLADTSQVADLFAKILSSKIRFFLNARNEVERMEGADELMNRLKFGGGVKLKPGADWDKKELEGMMKQMVTSTQQPDHFFWLKRLFTKAYFESKIRHYFLPPHPVRLGDTWPILHEYPMGDARPLERVFVRNFVVTFKAWEHHGQRLCARLEFQGTEKTKIEHGSTAARLAVPSTAGTYSGLAWFDPELGRVLEVVSTRDFKVTSDKFVNPFANPAAAGPLQSATDVHHQVITEKLVSMEGIG